MKRILVVDSHELVRVGLKHVIQEAIPGCTWGDAGRMQEAIRLATEQEWDLVLLELAIEGNRGLEILKEIKRVHPQIPVLVVTGYSEKQYALRAIKAGAAGYFSKSNDTVEFLAATKKVLQGGRYVSSELARDLERRSPPQRCGIVE